MKMKATILSFMAFMVAILAASCGNATHTVDEGTVDELRRVFDQTRCGFRMEDLVYAVSRQFPYLVADSLPPDVIPAGVPDSLTKCPVTLEPYGIRFEIDVITVECPSGHGSASIDY